MKKVCIQVVKPRALSEGHDSTTNKVCGYSDPSDGADKSLADAGRIRI